MKERMEAARAAFQAKLDELLKDGAECVVHNGGERVTSFILASFEVLKALPFISRITGKLLRFTYWCWFQEVHFEAGMQRSHLAHIKQVAWLNVRNLSLETDDHALLISALDPPEVDERGNAVWQEWKEFQTANPWLEQVKTNLRTEYQEIVKRVAN